MTAHDLVADLAHDLAMTAHEVTEVAGEGQGW